MITDKLRIIEQFQGDLEACFLNLEELQAPGIEGFKDELLALHDGTDRESSDFTSVIDDYDRGFDDSHSEAKEVLQGLRRLYDWVSSPSAALRETPSEVQTDVGTIPVVVVERVYQ